MELSRRAFLRAGAGGALVLGLTELSWPPCVSARVAGPDGGFGYRDWRDVYRERWTWDRVVRGTHTNTNCVSSCAWNLYVRQGIVWREEQAGLYGASNETLPDFNPRGCNKGACASHLFLGPARITHPLRRNGPRGSGRWKRVRWEQALDEIADGLIDEMVDRGGTGILCELGPNIGFGPNSAAPLRFFRQLGAPLTDSMAMIGDLSVGGTITLGTPHTDGTSDDWFRSEYLVFWACNPVATRIPDAHFLTEARYRGTRVVVVSPDYNQTAVHADLWLSPRPGTDAALALAACQVILEEQLEDVEYLREQTDLPFLVRSDTGRFLREADLVEHGQKNRFAVWDEKAERVVLAPGTEGDDRKTLLWKEVRPSLDTARSVKLLSGKSLQVETVLRRLRRALDAAWRPEQAARVTGLSVGAIRRFAHEFAGSKASLILAQWGSCKNYHSDLIQRSQILLASLTGGLGRAGAGWRSGAFIALEGFALLAMMENLGISSLAWLMLRSKLWPETILKEFDAGYVSSTLFHAVHGGLDTISGKAEYGDPRLTQGSAPLIREAVEQGLFPIGAGPDDPPPSVIFSIFGNVLRHARSYPRVRERLFDPARLVVDINFRMSETGRHSDFVLPSASWYEKIGLKYIAGFVPYVTLGDRAVEPRGEARPEWEIFWRLAERVARRTRQRGIGPVRSWRGEERDMGRLLQTFSDAGRYGPDDEEKLVEFVLRVSSASSGVTLEDLRREAATRLEGIGDPGGTNGIYSDYSKHEPIVPFRDFFEKKQPYPTLTGRQQFYIDHPRFLELDEALPTHKDAPAVGGDHPFVLTGGHTRWSIHAQWRDEELMLRLQRGEPVIYLNSDDCRKRAIDDHDRVVVSNALGSFIARAKRAAGIRPGQAHIFHAWEPYQFLGGRSHQAITPSPIKATQLVGDYGQLHWAYGHYEPNQVDRDTRVDIRRYTAAEDA